MTRGTLINCVLMSPIKRNQIGNVGKALLLAAQSAKS